MDKTGRSNGLYFDRRGNLISCADEKNELWSISPDKKVTVLLSHFEGKRLNGPNDLWIDPKGGIYFTDPYYQREYWDRKQPDIPGQKVYYLPKGQGRSRGERGCRDVKHVIKNTPNVVCLRHEIFPMDRHCSGYYSCAGWFFTLDVSS
jgi:sugar lactone lactonase YvrE